MLLCSTQDMKILLGRLLQKCRVVCLSVQVFFKLENLLEVKKTLGACSCSTDPNNCIPKATIFLQLPSAKRNMELCSPLFLPFCLTSHKQLSNAPSTYFKHHLGSDFPSASVPFREVVSMMGE